MGVGYQVSALHSISYLEPIEGAPADVPPPSWLSLMPNTHWDGRPTRFVSPRGSDIVAWRGRIAVKYYHQLGELLTWDETSEFSAGEDLATSWDVILRYVAAVLDLNGETEAARQLKGQKKPKPEIYRPLFEAVERRGFTGRFPQLLLRADCWLPFRRNMIIEEPDWNGNVDRYGSASHLTAEIATIQRFIAAADITAPTAPDTDEPDVLPAAWKAAEPIHRLGSLAVQKHLPLWTTS